MRAISLWQPWASAVALGLKRYETRHWRTGYLGPLAIHAAKKDPRSVLSFQQMQAYLKALDISSDTMLPYGGLVAVVLMAGCRRTEDVAHQVNDDERFWGNWEPGRYCWALHSVRALEDPIPMRGRQGMWTLMPEEEAAAGGRPAADLFTGAGTR